MGKKIIDAVLREKLDRRSAVSADRGWTDASGVWTPCREWQGARHEKGYGRLWDGERLQYVHREEWRLSKGGMPAGLDVLHRCDNPPCREIGHLFVGDQADNNRDRDAKGRGGGHKLIGRARGPSRMRGTRHKRAKLTEEQVREIKRRLPTEKGAALASEFGVSASLVYGIGQGTNWGWLE